MPWKYVILVVAVLLAVLLAEWAAVWILPSVPDGSGFSESSASADPSGAVSPVFDPMVRVTAARSRRISSHDRTGGNLDCLEIGPGQTAVIADIQGPGSITHLYFTLFNPDPLDFRDAVLRIYWDGRSVPAVEVPFGDFFCVGHATPRRFESAMMTVTLGQGPGQINCGLNCYFPMPFATGARLEIQNQADRVFGGGLGRVWYHVDHEVFDAPPPGDVGRFHARWRRETLTTPEEAPRLERGVASAANTTGAGNYVLLETAGHGQVVGQFLQVDNVEGGWFGEGDDMVFIDQDTWPPSLHGTGTEEIFGAGALPDREYAGHYAGFVLMETRGGVPFQGKNAMYRWYVRDPIRFTRRIRMTVEHGHANQSANDYASVVYWYQKEPLARHSPLPPRQARCPRFPEAFHAARAAGAEVNRRLLPVRKAFFENGVPLPSWLTPLDVKLGQAYAHLCCGRHEQARVIYADALDAIRTHLGERAER